MKKAKRAISILMCAVLLLCLLPTAALADGEGTLTISVVKAENASVTVSYQFLNESGESIGQSQPYSSPVKYASGTSKVIVSVSTEETLREVNLSGSLYNPPKSDTLKNAFSAEGKSYTFALGGIGDTIELTLNYTDTPINNNPGNNEETQPPQVSTGDIALNIENSQCGTVFYKIGESTPDWTQITGNPFTLRASVELQSAAQDTKIYFKATANQDQKVDDGDGRNRVRYDDTDHNISHTDLENGAYYLTYNPAKTYSMQIAFMSAGGNTPQDQTGNLALTVTLKVYQYKIDHQNGGYETISRPTDPTGFIIESFKLNDFECFLKQDATVTFVNGGYAVTGDQKNTLSFRESFGGKAEAIYLIDVAEDGTATKIAGSDFTWNPNAEEHNGRWELANIAPAESYNIAIVEGVSDDLTVIWTTDYDTAANWNLDGSFATGMYVEHGQVAVASIKRGNDILYDGHQVANGATGVGVNITEKFGYVTLTRGDTVTLKLIPDYGYQLKSVGAVTSDTMTAANEVSTFTISNIQNNIHFSSIFEAASNQVTIGSGTSITNAAVNATGIASGIVAMDVSGVETKDVSATTQGTAIATVDIALTNRVSKGTGTEYWDASITEVPNDGAATVSLTVDGLEPGATYAVVREHEGEDPTVLPATNENGTLTFASDKFSAYTIVKTADVPSPPSVPTGPSSSGGGADTTPSGPIISQETKPDGSTTTTESKPDGTVTESNTSKPVTDASGNTSQTTTETSTGKDGVTESKTETVTKPDGSASSTTESTTTKPDGTTTESKTETTINADGSSASTTTATTTNKDGTVTESKTEATTSTVTNKDGSTTETKQETTTTSTGSKTESTTVTTVNKDGSSTATSTATTTDKAGTVTESKTESTTNKNGTTTAKTTTTETKANGTVTESKTETITKANGTSSSTTTETVTKADGTTTTSKTTATTSLSTNQLTGTVTETKKETTTTSDGVKSEGTTVTQIQKDGTVTSTETVKASDSTGTTATKTTTLDAKGEVTTTAEVSVSAKAVTEAAKTGGAVTIPVEVTATKSTSTAPTVSVSVPKTAESVKVELPVQNVTPGTVAVIVNADGTEKIVSTSVVTENGVALTLDGSATVKLVDNAKSFSDVPETDVFYNEISSLSARNIMIGVSSERFDLHNSVTLDQVANVAGRITGAVDVSDFNAGVAWGKDGGLKTGSMAATRGEVLKALYIAAGSPAVEDTSILSRFKDASSIPADLAAIAAWAAQNGILKGNMDGTAGLSANVTRGQACALAGRTMGALA